ncbi:MAG: hypothetical protein AB1589_23005 [Cyanobacteriota bacterium]
MNITKTELKNELNLESLDEVIQAQQQLHHSNIDDSFLSPGEANEIRRYIHLRRSGLAPQEAEQQAKLMTTNQPQSSESLHTMNGHNQDPSVHNKPSSKIEQILQRQQNLTHSLIELSHAQAELLEAKAWTQFQSTYASKLNNDISKFTDDMTALFALMNNNIENTEFISTEEYEPLPFELKPKTPPLDRLPSAL